MVEIDLKLVGTYTEDDVPKQVENIRKCFASVTGSVKEDILSIADWEVMIIQELQKIQGKVGLDQLTLIDTLIKPLLLKNKV